MIPEMIQAIKKMASLTYPDEHAAEPSNEYVKGVIDCISILEKEHKQYITELDSYIDDLYKGGKKCR